MANEKLKDENKILKLNVSKKHDHCSTTLSPGEYIIPGSLTPPQSYISDSSPERSEGASSPPTSPDIIMSDHHTTLVQVQVCSSQKHVYLCFFFYIYIITEQTFWEKRYG